MNDKVDEGDVENDYQARKLQAIEEALDDALVVADLRETEELAREVMLTMLRADSVNLSVPSKVVDASWTFADLFRREAIKRCK